MSGDDMMTDLVVTNANRFVGKDYAIWRNRMKMILHHKGSWRIITGEWTRPEHSGPELEKFVKKNQEALSYLTQHLGNDQFRHVTDVEDAKELIRVLDKIYQSSSIISQMSIAQDFYTITKSPTMTMEAHIALVRDLAQRLRAAGHIVEDKLITMRLLHSLPESWRQFSTSCGATSTQSDFTWQKVSSMILDEEKQRGLQTGSTRGGAQLNFAKGMNANSGSSGRKYQGFKKRRFCTECKSGTHDTTECWILHGAPRGTPRCSTCNKYGHTSDRCRSRSLNTATVQRGRVQKARLFHANAEGETSNYQDSSWYIDSGASHHMCHNGDTLTTYKEIEPLPIQMGNGSIAHAIGEGSTHIKTLTPKGIKQLTLEDVLHVPAAKKNFVSVTALTNEGHTLNFNGSTCTIVDKANQTVGVAKNASRIYKIVHPNTGILNTATTDIVDNKVWHERLGHIAVSKIVYMANKHIVRNLEVTDSNTAELKCNACIFGKQCRTNFPKYKPYKKQRRLELVHSDLCGHMSIASFNGAVYFMSFIDDNSRKSWIYFLKTKREALEKFKIFKALVENESGLRLRALRTDNGGEYMSHAFQDYLQSNGIRHELTAPYTPQQNGIAERLNRSIMERARSMLHHADLSNIFWAEAVHTANYLRNFVPTKVLGDTCPEEVWTGYKPSVQHLRVFGCDAYVHIPREMRTKLDPRSQKGILVGYGTHSSTYKVKLEGSRQAVFSRDVVFDETSFIRKPYDQQNADKHTQHSSEELEQHTNVDARTHVANVLSHDELEQHTNVDARTHVANTLSHDSERTITAPLNAVVSSEHSQEGYIASSSRTVTDTGMLHRERNIAQQEGPRPGPQPIQEPMTPQGGPEEGNSVNQVEGAHGDVAEDSGVTSTIQPRRSSRDRRPPERYGVLTMAIADPTSYKEAVYSNDAAHWRKAMEDEISSLIKNKTWELVDLPKNKNLVKSKWVYKTKLDEKGAIDRYKARLVAKGYSQIQGIDYEEVFAPVAKIATIRTLLAFAVYFNWEVHQMDVKTAFLNGELTEEIYMEQPEGFQSGTNKVCRLKKSLYGLKQASRTWYQCINDYLLSVGFNRCSADDSLYIMFDKNEQVIIVLYVDDTLIFGSNVAIIQRVKLKLMEKFEMTDQGKAHFCLGIQMERHSCDVIRINQAQYLRQVLTQYGMAECHIRATPMDKAQVKPSGNKKSIGQSTKTPKLKKESYRNLIGSLNYAMICTRPDISYAVNKLSQRVENPTEEDCTALQGVLRYLAETLEKSLTYEKCEGGNILQGYTDSDFAGDPIDRKSTSAYVFTLSGGAISWKTKKQTIVAQATCEAEYVAANECTKEAIWLRRLLADLKLRNESPTLIWGDNQGSLALAKNPVNHQRNKHIDVKYHFIRDQVSKGAVELKYCPTNSMLADVLTKAVDKQQFNLLVTKMGLK